jgi:hypothetical protein
MKSHYIVLFFLAFVSVSCDDFLDVVPQDRITSANFPENEQDIKLAVNGLYALLRESSVYNEGLFGYGVLDGATPNAFNWGNLPIAKAGNGQLSSGDGDIVTFRWTRCYAIVARANDLLNFLEQVDLPEESKNQYAGEAYFLRGLAYSL